jgi:hypothetical protein
MILLWPQNNSKLLILGKGGCPDAVQPEGGHQAEEAGGGLRHSHLLLRSRLRQRSF